MSTNEATSPSNRFLVLLGLPTAAIGFCLSSAVASTSWLLSTRYDLHVENIALIWLMGPLIGLLVQPLVGYASDRTWWISGRRRPYLLVGGTAGAAATYALLHLDAIAAATGVGLLAVAVVVVLVNDLATNVTFNPARSLVADLTAEGPDRVRGYTWMQLVSGVFGISAYLVSIFYGNAALVLATVGVTFLLTVVPALLIREPAVLGPSSAERIVPADPARPAAGFGLLLPMAGFALFGAAVAMDRTLFDRALAAWTVPGFLIVLASVLAAGGALAWRSRARPTATVRLRLLLLGHGLAWLGVQGMFVMGFFYVRDVVVAGTDGVLLADILYRLANPDSTSSAGDTAGRVFAMGLLLMNVVGALLPVLALKPLCARFGAVAVHRAAIGSMALSFLLIAIAPPSEGTFYLGMLLCGIGWSSLISIVFAIFSESVDARGMGLGMGVFNASLVLPALAVPALLQISEGLDGHRGMFLLFAASLALSWLVWSFVSERRPGLYPDAS